MITTQFYFLWLHIRVTSDNINLILPQKRHLGLSIWNLMGKTFEKKMTLAGCEQQVGNHWTKEWFCCWNLITFIEMRDLQRLFNLILLPGRLTYSWCVRNAIFQMTSSPVTKSGYGPCKVLDLLHVWVFETLVFPLCADFFHSSFFNFKCSTVGRLILLHWVPGLFEYMCSHCDNSNWVREKA